MGKEGQYTVSAYSPLNWSCAGIVSSIGVADKVVASGVGKQPRAQLQLLL